MAVAIAGDGPIGEHWRYEMRSLNSLGEFNERIWRLDMSERLVERLVQAVHAVEGEGFAVRRAFPTSRVDSVDPFLLLDHVGPRDLEPGEAKGAPDHPHRGFETVTYVLEGETEHKDSAGHRGSLGPGDIQWMTAGSGVVHSEMPTERIRRSGGRLHFLQLWVNLPAEDKMVPARYQHVGPADIPVVHPAEGVTVRVIAGRVFGATGPVETHSPFQYARCTLDVGASVEVPIPVDQEVFAYVMTGNAQVGTDPVDAPDGSLAIFGSSGDAVYVTASTDSAADLIIVSGRPLHEPVARYGPFVMNTREEILQAVEDFQRGQMGQIEV